MKIIEKLKQVQGVTNKSSKLSLKRLIFCVNLTLRIYNADWFLHMDLTWTLV